MMDQIDMTAQQAMRPEWVDWPPMPQEVDAAAFIGAAQINQRAFGRRLPIDVPVCGKGPARKFVLMSLRQVLPVSFCKTLRSRTERRQIFMVKACPDLLLPQTVEVFDDPLEAHFKRRRKNGRDSQGQTKAHDPANYVRMIMPALKADIPLAENIQNTGMAAYLGYP